MDPHDLLIIPFRRWRILAACVLMSVAVGLLTLPAPIHKRVATGPLEYKATAVLGNAAGAGKGGKGTALIEWSPVIKSDVIINAVGTQLNLIAMEVAGLHKSITVKA